MIETLICALWCSLSVKGVLTGQDPQFLFDLEVLQTHGAGLLCERQPGGALNKGAFST